MLPLRFIDGGGGTGGITSTSDKLGVSLWEEKEGCEYQAVDKREIALNQNGHEQLPTDVTPQRAFEKD